jgi:hypothetical protein
LIDKALTRFGHKSHANILTDRRPRVTGDGAEIWQPVDVHDNVECEEF